MLGACLLSMLGGAVASWLARSTPERVLRVRALAGDVVLCSWARHFTLTVPLSTQVYKCVPANLMLGVPCDGLASPPGGSRNTPSRFMLQKLMLQKLMLQKLAWWATWPECRLYFFKLLALERAFISMYRISRAIIFRFNSKTQWVVSVILRPPHLCPPRRTQTWRLHTKLYKFGWHTSANNARMKNSKDLIFGDVVNISIIYHIPDSWLYSLKGYDF